MREGPVHFAPEVAPRHDDALRLRVLQRHRLSDRYLAAAATSGPEDLGRPTEPPLAAAHLESEVGTVLEHHHVIAAPEEAAQVLERGRLHAPVAISFYYARLYSILISAHSSTRQ